MENLPPAYALKQKELLAKKKLAIQHALAVRDRMLEQAADGSPWDAYNQACQQACAEYDAGMKALVDSVELTEEDM